MALLLKETSADMIARSQDMHGGQTKPVSQQFCILVYLLKYKNRIYMTVTGHNSSGVWFQVLPVLNIVGSPVNRLEQLVKKKIVLRLQCQSCKHVSQHAVKVYFLSFYTCLRLSAPVLLTTCAITFWMICKILPIMMAKVEVHVLLVSSPVLQQYRMLYAMYLYVWSSIWMMIARMPSIIWANASERAPSSLAAAAVTRDGVYVLVYEKV